MKNFSKPMIALGAVIILLLWGIGSYNSLVSIKGQTDQSWANVSVQLQRRFDLIPNIIESVKGNTAFEQETLTQVVEARSSWARGQQTGDINEQISAANSAQSALSRLLVTVEAYPTLQANQAFTELRVELSGAENRIAVARRDYNQAATTYNIEVKKFPRVIFAKIFGFEAVSLFENTDQSNTVPTVNFN